MGDIFDQLEAEQKQTSGAGTSDLFDQLEAEQKGKTADSKPSRILPRQPPTPPPVDPNASAWTNYWAGSIPNDNPLSRVLNMPQEGYRQAVEGLKQAWNASGPDPWPERAAGIHGIVSGVGHGLAPAVVIPAVANPVGTAVALGGGALAGWGAKTGLEAAGVRPEYAEVGGDVGSLAGGWGATKALSGSVGPFLANKVPKALEQSALKNYLRVLRTNPEDVPLAEEMAGRMAKEKIIAPSRKSLQAKTLAEKERLGPQAGAAYADKPSVDPANIFDSIERLRRENATVQGPQGEVITNEPLHNAMTEMTENLRAMQDSEGRIPAKALDDYRDQLFKGTVGATGKYRLTAPQSARSMERGVAQSIKGVLDSEFPDAAKINDAYRMKAKIYQFLETARRQDVSAGSKGTGTDALSRAVKLPKELSIPLKILNALDTVPWNTFAGATKQRLANALASSRWAEAEAIMKPLRWDPAATGPKRITTGDIIPPHSMLDPQANPSFKPTPGQFPLIDKGSHLEVWDPQQQIWIRMPKPKMARGGVLRGPTRGEILRSLGARA